MKTNTNLFNKTLAILCVILVITIKEGKSQPALDWAKGLLSSQYVTTTSSVVDVQGNIYTIGYFEGTADFDPGIGIHNLTSVGGTDVYILKLNAIGNFLWVKTIGSDDWEFSTSISLDGTGNIYYSGEFSKMLDFDPGSGISNLTPLVPSYSTFYDLFFSKLDSNGNFIWAKNIGSKYTGIFSPRSIVDQTGNLYVTGSFIDDSVDFDPGIANYYLPINSNHPQDVFISKFDPSGNFLWVKFFHGKKIAFVEPTQIALDASSNIYTTGFLSDSVDFDPGINTHYLGSKTGSYYYTSKLDNNGNFLWANAVHQPLPLSLLGSQSIHVDLQGNVYTTGSFSATVDFNPGNGTSYLWSATLGDVFINKLDNNGNFIWVKHLKGSGSGGSSGYSITSDPLGYIYVTGSYSDIVDFNPGPGSAILNFNSIGGTDIFILQLDNNGNYIWATGMGSSSDDFGYAINIDGLGNIISSGQYTGTCDFDPNTGIFNLSCSNISSTYIHKMSYSGNSINDENAHFNNFFIYPNPASNSINIKFSSTTENSIIKLYEATGKLINTYTNINNSNYSIDLSDQSIGMYFIEVKNNNFISREKLIISK